MLEQICTDVRLAWRGLRRTKAIAAVSAMTLSIGITGTATLFAIVDGILLKPLPVHEQERLVVIWRELPTSRGRQWPFRASVVTLLNDASRTIERAAGYGSQDPVAVSVSEDGVAADVNLSRITGQFFDVLGVAPILGRAMSGADDVEGAERVAILTHRLWQQRYAGARDAIGRRLVINEEPFTVVGVMPPGFDFPRGVDVWVAVAPLAGTVQNPAFREAVANELTIVARMKPGVPPDEIAADVDVLAPAIDADTSPGTPQGLAAAFRSYEETVVGDVRGGILVLFGAVTLVLLIATANVANLLLMRVEARRPELAVRAALGATRVHLTRQMAAEGAVLALVSGMLGLTATWVALPALARFVPPGLSRADTVGIDMSVVVFTAAVAFLASAGATVAPTMLATRGRLTADIARGGRTATGAATRRSRRALVVTQVAVAVVVLVAAGLLARTVLRLHAVADELAADRLMFVPLALPQEKYADPVRRLQLLNGAMERLEALPAVAAATPVNVEPFSGVGWDVPAFTAEGQSRERAEANPSLNLEAVHPNYFATFEVDILQGRTFTATDNADGPLVAMVSEEVARGTWPGEDPIGKRLKFGSIDSEDGWRTVVGITTPTRYRDIREQQATVYVPAEQLMVSAQALVIRTSASDGALAAAIADSLRAVDPDVRVLRVAPFDELLAAPLARPRFNAFLISVFGISAMLLAAVGLYAVMTASVRAREREIGVRVALGATVSRICTLVLTEAFRIVATGIAIGLAITAAASQLLRQLLFEIDPLDPTAVIAAGVTMLSAAAIASGAPVLRATRTDPVAMLRAQ